MAIRRKVGNVCAVVGFNPYTTLNFCRGLPFYFRESNIFRRKFASSESSSSFVLRRSLSFSGDRFSEAGATKGHYFCQDLFVAKQVFAANPVRHIDVGSRIDGFVAHVASFRSIDVLDVRNLDFADTNIHFHQSDLMSLNPRWYESTDSLSCLHALEHFGLGRYGDPLDPDGWIKGLTSLKRILKPGGTLYLSVPTGLTQRVEFNSQRVFSFEFLFPILSSMFKVKEITLLTETGKLTSLNVEDPSGYATLRLSEFDCSIWVLKRRMND